MTCDIWIYSRFKQKSLLELCKCTWIIIQVNLHNTFVVVHVCPSIPDYTLISPLLICTNKSLYFNYPIFISFHVFSLFDTMTSFHLRQLYFNVAIFALHSGSVFLLWMLRAIRAGSKGQGVRICTQFLGTYSNIESGYKLFFLACQTTSLVFTPRPHPHPHQSPLYWIYSSKKCQLIPSQVSCWKRWSTSLAPSGFSRWARLLATQLWTWRKRCQATASLLPWRFSPSSPTSAGNSSIRRHRRTRLK